MYGIRGELNSSVVLAVSTIRPAYITATRSARVAAMPMSCVIMMTPAPVMSRALRSRLRICFCTVTSSAVVGSSQMISAGSFAIAMAMTTRWRIPPENSCGKALARTAGSGIPTRSSSSTARAAASDLLIVPCASRASVICSPTRYTGVSAESGSWNTMLMELPRSLDNSRSPSPSSSRPRRRIEPLIRACSGSRPITASADTDLPEPDSPTMASTSPSETA